MIIVHHDTVAQEAIALSKDLVARVRAFRFARQIDQESDAYSWLLEHALAAVEREDQGETAPKAGRAKP